VSGVALSHVLEAAADHLTDAVLVADGDGRIVHANAAACAALGYALDDLRGLSLAELLGDEGGGAWSRLQPRLPGVHNVTVEGSLRCRDGALRPVELVAARIEVGGRTWVCALARDITLRRQDEAARERSEELYRTTVDSLEDWLHVVDDQLRFVLMNAAFTDVNARLGLPTAVAGRPLREVYPFLTPKLEDEYAQVIRTGRSLTTEETNVIGGNTFVTETKKVPVFDGGRVARVVTVIRDVTALRLAEAERRKSEERLRAVSETASDCIFIKDVDCRYTHVNPQLERLFGVSEASLLGRQADALFGAEIGARITAAERRVLAGETTAEERRLPVRGVAHDFHVIEVPIRDETGAIVGLCGIARDITERLRAQEERRRLEARMQRVQRAESLGVLAGGLAHDFNNLLTTILGNAELLLSTVGGAGQARRQLQKVATAARRAAELTQQLLAYAGGGQFSLERVDLSAVAVDTIGLLPQSRARTLQVTTELAASLPAVEGDPAQLRQAVMACFLNATEAVGEEGGTVTVRTGAADLERAELAECTAGDDLEPGRYVWIEIVDTGCGIPPEDLERIFDPFFSTKFTGRGLGLAAVLGIVRAHSGAICVKSAPGAGSTFRILLPACVP
jgi:PAS domain S-box-containing protein